MSSYTLSARCVNIEENINLYALVCRLCRVIAHWMTNNLNVLQCLCELPESYEAYRKQQHRWHSGPMQLFRLCLPDIIKSKVCIVSSLTL